MFNMSDFDVSAIEDIKDSKQEESKESDNQIIETPLYKKGYEAKKFTKNAAKYDLKNKIIIFIHRNKCRDLEWFCCKIKKNCSI